MDDGDDDTDDTDDDTDDDHDTDDDNYHKHDSYTAGGAAPGASVPYFNVLFLALWTRLGDLYLKTTTGGWIFLG